VPAITSRRATWLAVAVVGAVLVAGCGGGTATSTAASTPTSSTLAPTTTTIPPLTAKELAWLEAISKLHKKLDKVWTDSPTNLTSAVMSALAKGLRG